MYCTLLNVLNVSYWGEIDFKFILFLFNTIHLCQSIKITDNLTYICKICVHKLKTKYLICISIRPGLIDSQSSVLLEVYASKSYRMCRPPFVKGCVPPFILGFIFSFYILIIIDIYIKIYIIWLFFLLLDIIFHVKYLLTMHIFLEFS